jgi:hypothetical protein
MERLRRVILGASPGAELADDVLSANGEDWAVVSLNLPDDGLFEQEVEEFEELVDEAEGRGKSRVKKLLSNCSAIIGLQVLMGGTEGNEALDRLNGVFASILTEWPGLMHFDGDGFYDLKGLVLERD